MHRKFIFQNRIGFSLFLWAAAGIGLFVAPAVACESAVEPFQAEFEREVPASGVGAAYGVVCETRNSMREVSRRNFVVDRVTECRPKLTMLSVPGLPEPTKSISVERAEGAMPGASVVSVAQIARWSDDHRRLSNAQYDRSLRAMKEAFKRRPVSSASLSTAPATAK